MQISLEISMYPLKTEYAKPILAFIDQILAEDELTVVRNNLSTHIFGDYQRIMRLMTEEIGVAFQTYPETVFILKIVGKNLAPDT